MNSDELVVRLALELYDLKKQLEDVRNMAAYLEIYELDDRARQVVIKIQNRIDESEVYE